MPLTPDEVEHRIQSTRRMSPKQAQFIVDLINARYEEDDEDGRRPWRERWSLITNHSQVSAMIEDLRATPTLDQLRRQAREQRPSEDGYYRNPETGELFRISHSVKDRNLIISRYSLTGGPRRLVADTDEIVKGSWKRLGMWASRQIISSLKADWLIDPTTLAQDFAYAFCPLHHGPLTDGVSVILGYGPDCAEKHGLPWSEEAAQAVLAARQSQGTS